MVARTPSARGLLAPPRIAVICGGRRHAITTSGGKMRLHRKDDRGAVSLATTAPNSSMNPARREQQARAGAFQRGPALQVGRGDAHVFHQRRGARPRRAAAGRGRRAGGRRSVIVRTGARAARVLARAGWCGPCPGRSRRTAPAGSRRSCGCSAEACCSVGGRIGCGGCWEAKACTTGANTGYTGVGRSSAWPWPAQAVVLGPAAWAISGAAGCGPGPGRLRLTRRTVTAVGRLGDLRCGASLGGSRAGPDRA